MTDTFPSSGDGAGEWNQYARLILHQLQQLSDGYEGIRKDFSDFLRKQDADHMAVAQLRRDVERRFEEQHISFIEFRDGMKERLDDKDTGLVARVETLEDSNTVANAFKQGRWWVISGAFVILTAIILPTASLLWK